jgi:hypothetical protein
MSQQILCQHLYFGRICDGHQQKRPGPQMQARPAFQAALNREPSVAADLRLASAVAAVGAIVAAAFVAAAIRATFTAALVAAATRGGSGGGASGSKGQSARGKSSQGGKRPKSFGKHDRTHFLVEYLMKETVVHRARRERRG